MLCAVTPASLTNSTGHELSVGLTQCYSTFSCEKKKEEKRKRRKVPVYTYYIVTIEQP
jgi:hypothetical protein